MKSSLSFILFAAAAFSRIALSEEGVDAAKIVNGALAIGQDSVMSGPKTQEGTQEKLRYVTVDLSKVRLMSTLVEYTHTTSPPWPMGNGLTFSSNSDTQSGLPTGEWVLANMHTENFDEVVKRRNLKEVRLALLGDNTCFVVDSRVPAEWLLTTPRYLPLEQRLSFRSRFPDFFCRDPQAESLIGTTWILVSRKDPRGVLERVLPGDTIHFDVFELTCHTAAGEMRRFWEFDRSRTPFWLSVYNVQSTNNYTGANLEFTRNDDEMVLVPKNIFKTQDKGLFSERYDGPTTATYRIKQ